MSQEFRMGLEGNRYTENQQAEPQLSFVQKFGELNRRMYLTNQRMRDHPYGSKWYQWPLGEKAVGYWRRGELDIAMQPNLVVWWAVHYRCYCWSLHPCCARKIGVTRYCGFYSRATP